ncbi:MAG: T9SS type A sorting domain-containing protein, partial [Chlorobi bacterium]|nr:T9SS type A sorting domain-containing protein [Chlorobiota bacterium]
AGGPFAVDDNTMLLLHFNGGLANKSLLSGDGTLNGTNVSYSLANNNPNLGQSINLDGSSYVTVIHNTNLNLNGDWTIELWFRPTEFSTYQYFVQKPGDTDSYFSNYSLELQSGWGNVLHGFYFSNEQARINVVEMSPTLNKWYHVAFIRDISNSKISIIVHDENWNEVSSSSQNYSGNDNNVLLNTKNLRIGEGFIGDIDELRISNVVRNFDVLGVQESILSDKYKMYPNPSKNNLNINLPQEADLSIYTLTGQKVLEKKNIKKGIIDISKLKSGLYIVLFNGEKGTLSKKLIIE